MQRAWSSHSHLHPPNTPFHPHPIPTPSPLHPHPIPTSSPFHPHSIPKHPLTSIASHVTSHSIPQSTKTKDPALGDGCTSTLQTITRSGPSCRESRILSSMPRRQTPQYVGESALISGWLGWIPQGGPKTPVFSLHSNLLPQSALPRSSGLTRPTLFGGGGHGLGHQKGTQHRPGRMRRDGRYYGMGRE